MFSSGLADRRKGWLLLAAVFVAALIFALVRLLQGEPDTTPLLVTSTAGPALAMETGSPALNLAGVSHHDPLENVKYAPDVLVVRFDRNASAAQRRAARSAVGAKKKKSLSLPGAELLTLPKGSNEPAVAAKLSKQPGVKYSEPDGVVHATVTPDDAEFGELWGLNNTGQDDGTADADIDAPEAWNTTTGSSSVVTAVIDTGVDYNHEDLSENIWENPGETGTDDDGNPEFDNGLDDDHNGWVDDWRGVNYVGENNQPFNDPMDNHFHGTHVAGTIAGKGNNGVGVAGVTWNTKIMPVKVLSSGGGGFNSVIADGMAYAAENGAQVANLSLGGGYRSQYMEDVVASHPETLYVVAAGNSRNNNDTNIAFYPCNLKADNVVCVAATDRKDALAEFSDYGPINVDLAAPGVDILSAKASVDVEHPGKYRSLNGTSMATPHVAGAASLLLADKPQATTDQIRDALLDSVDKIPSVTGKVSSGGRLNVNNALTKLNTALTRDPSITTVELGGSGDLRFTSGVGLDESLTVAEGASEVEFVDSAAEVLAGDGCTPMSLHRAVCSSTGVKRIVVSTGDGNDHIDVAASLPTKLNAGSGDDTVLGGPGDDEMINGAGTDSYTARGGTDTISYSASSGPVTVTLDGEANDGAAGENDSVSTDFETVLGGLSNDTLTAGSNGATLNGNAGDDTITGGPGDDVLFDGAGSDVMDGMGGDDALTYTDHDGADSWNGGSGTDTVDGSRISDRNGIRLSLDDVANDGAYLADNYHDDIENLIGSEEGDTLVGSSGDNKIDGRDGIDTLDGGSGGDDEFIGGSPRLDSVTYSSREDNLNLSIDDEANDGAPTEHDNIHRDIENVVGGSGDDTIVGDNGGGSQELAIDLFGSHYEANDIIDGGPGADVISGAGGDDVVMYGGRQASEPVNVNIDGLPNDGGVNEHDNVTTDTEAVMGSYGDDVITGSSGPNVLNGGHAGNDTINGAGGDDTLSGGAPGQHDTYSGGDGVDTVDYWGDITTVYYGYNTPVSITLDGVDNDGYAGSSDHYSDDVERFRGGMSDDTLVGNGEANHLDGGGGTNTIDGGAGDDTVIGGGADSTVMGGEGNDTVQSVYFKWYLSYWYGGYGGIGVFLGMGGGDVDGGPGNDKLYGSAAGSENLNGGDGNDTLDGSYDDDTFSGGDGVDTADYSDRNEYLDVSLDGVANDGWICTCGGSGEKDQVLSDVENVTAGAGNDKLTGDEHANGLDGGWGQDEINAGDGDDLLTGGEDADKLFAAVGNDLIKSSDDSADVVTCGDGTDSVREDSTDSLAADCEPDGAPTAPTISLGPGHPTGESIEYDSVPGLADNVTVTAEGGSALFTATGHDLDADDGCTQAATNEVRCQFVDATDLLLNVHLGDQNDSFTVSASASTSARVFGGTGIDTLTGGANDDILDGGAGADFIEGGPGARDVVSYANRSNPLNVSLDGVANDGEFAENDYVGTSIEDVTGGSGNDVLVGSAGTNYLFGMNGDDVLDGGLGGDFILGAGDTDTVTYASRTNPVTIAPAFAYPANFVDEALGNSVWSGEVGEHDWVGSDTEVEIGGSGNDTLRCDKTLYGMSNTLEGGPGVDQYTDCALDENNGTATPASDTVSYASHTVSVDASTDGVANDGAAGENENIPDGVENITGGSAGDNLVAESAGIVDGGPGNDALSGDGKPQKFVGGSGTDTATYEGRTDALELSLDGVANDGADDEKDNLASDVENLVGGSGADSIEGKISVANSLAGGAGDDSIDSQDGNADHVDCGSGSDAASIDSFDLPVTDCESVNSKSVTTISRIGNEIVFDTTAGTDDEVVVTGSSAWVSVANSAETLMLVGEGCQADGASAAICTGGDPIESVRVSTNDGDDSISVPSHFGLPVNFDGGAGSDHLVGGNAADTLSGGPGDDSIESRDAHADQVDCGSGTDSAVTDGYDLPATECEDVDNKSVTSVSRVGNEVVYSTTAGADNDVTILGDAWYLRISDTADTLMVAGEGCSLNSTSEATCVSGGALFESVRVSTNDGDDSISVPSYFGVPVNVDGGAGADQLVGGRASDTLTGGPGDDSIDSQDGIADQVVCGGGSDAASIDSLDLPVTDCEAVNAKTVTTISRIGNEIFYSTTSGADNDVTVAGYASYVTVSDTADTFMVAGEGCWLNGSSEVGCGGGDPIESVRVSTNDGDDSISVPPGFALPVNFDGGAGSDHLVGGNAADTLTGGAGDDSIESRDAKADQVNCGTGTDSAITDAYDLPATECENVDNKSVTSVSRVGNEVVYSTTSGADNDVSVYGHASYVSITDAADALMVAGEGCWMNGSSEAICAGGDPIESVRVSTNDGDDSISVPSYSQLPVNLDGGAGSDHLVGGNAADTLIGGPGDDAIESRDAHADQVDCGSGTDSAVTDAYDLPATECENVDNKSVTSISRSGNEIVYSSTAGADNDVTISGDIWNVSITDAADTFMVAGEGCWMNGSSEAICAGGDPIESVRVSTNDGDDSISVPSHFALPVNFDGGAGSDHLVGGNAADTLTGGPGDDSIESRDAHADLVDCGSGTDSAVTDAYDLPATECENVDNKSVTSISRSGNEIVYSTTAGADNDVTIIGDATYLRISDAADAFMLASDGCWLNGNSEAICSGGAWIESVRVSTNDGDDSISVESNFALPVNFDGGAGADHLVGGNGADTLTGGAGDDSIESRDAHADQVNCGDGTDSAVTDGYDLPAAECENVDNKSVTSISRNGDELVYTTTSGTSNQVAVSGDATETRISDTADTLMVAGEGCLLSGASEAACSGGTPISSVRVSTDDGDDSVAVSPNFALPVNLDGGAGADHLIGGNAADTLSGGPGDDSIEAVDGFADQIDCGVGTDAAEVDDADPTPSSCESTHVNPFARASIQGNSVEYTSADGVANSITVTANAFQVDVTDTSGVRILPGNGCSMQTTTRVRCNRSIALSSVKINTADQNDSIVGVTAVSIPLIVDAGSGDDRMGSLATSDTFNGGGGTDVVDYSMRTNSITATLNGGINNGQANEHDKIALDVEGLIGGSGNDVFTGNAGVNLLDGGAGNDRLTSLAGDDDLRAGAGADTLDGGTGADSMDGGANLDIVTYTTRLASVIAAVASNASTSGNGESGENDTIANSESLIGGSAADTLRSTASGGTVTGGPGADSLAGSSATQTFIGNAGADTVQYSDRSDALELSLDGVANDGAPGENDVISTDIENLTGGDGPDTVSGSFATSNILNSGGGDDIVMSADGLYDEIICGAGDYDTAHIDAFDTHDCEGVAVQPASRVSVDQYGAVQFESSPGVSNDVHVSGVATSVTVSDLAGAPLGAGAGCSRVSSSQVSCSIPLGAYAVFAYLDDMDDKFEADQLHGVALNVDGGDGDDTLSGGDFGDYFSGGPGAHDRVTYATRSTPISAIADGSSASGYSGEGDRIEVDVEDLIGGTSDDLLSGNWESNTLDGGAGNDTLDGGYGDDSLIGGEGSNTASYASRSENITAAAGGTVQTESNGEAGESDVLDDINTLVGGSGDDTLSDAIPVEEDAGVSFSGGPGNDTINGGAAPDALSGDEGNDTLNGGNDEYGGDVLSGGDGDDVLHGGLGDESLDGGPGGDLLDGGGGFDYVDLSGRTANQTITIDNLANDGDPGEGDDLKSSVESIELGAGDDVYDATGSGFNAHYVNGHDGNDTLIGGSGVEHFSGDDGQDLLMGGLGGDYLWGGSGVDTVSYADHSTPVVVSIDSSATDGSTNEKDYVPGDVENLIGTAFNDTLRAYSSDGTLNGGAGDDLLDGRTGADVLDGGAGIDTATYSTRSAHLDLTVDNLANDGETGENDNILPSVEKLTAGSGPDFLSGGDADNTLTGGAGADTMMGHGGTDVFDGGADSDTVTYSDQTASIVAAIDDWPNDGIPGENDNIMSNVENIQGSQGTSNLTGSDAANTLSGAGGPVLAYGQGGNDSLIGGSVVDTLTGGAGQDTFDAGDGNDTVSSTDGEVDTGTCGNGTDTISSDVIDTVTDCEATPTPPETTITSGPSNNGYSTTATPTFTVTSTPTGASFECSIDGAPFSGCSTPYTTPTLSTVGTRTVSIRAKNAAGYVDPTPAARTFTVDLVDPSLTVTNPTGWLNGAAPWIVFSASDNIGLQPTKCAVDGGAQFTCTTNSNLPSQSAGPHTLVVTATDLAGRATSATKNYTIDTTSPNAVLTAPSGFQTTATPTVAFTSSDANGVTNTCSVDGGPYTPCTNGMTLPPQSYGSHQLTLWAQDPAGNVTTSFKYFQVDTTPADVSVSGAVLSIAPTDAGYNNNTTVSFAGSTYTVYEHSRATIKAGTGCVQVDAQTLTCTSASITSVTADMSDGNDQIGLGDTVTVPSTLSGGTGNDGVYGGSGADTLIGGTGADQLEGGTGVDTASYAERTNPVTLSGDGTPNDGEVGEGDSIGNAVESMVGGAGNDTFNSHTIASSEVFNGGAGVDTITYAPYSSPIAMNLTTTTAQSTGGAGTDTVSNIENVTGGTGADNLTGSAGDNVIIGLAGNDTINGAGNGTSGDTVDYSAASSAVTANLATGAVTGGAGSDTLTAIENVTGSASNDTINSAPGANIINGAGGTDTISYSTITTAVAVNLNTTTAQATGGGGSDTITNVENVTGGSAADNLTGTGGDNVIAGLAGNDTLAGGAGADTLNDSAATTAVVVNLASSTASGGAGTDVISGFENVTGSTANDTLTPSSGNNVIDGAGGTDTITYATAASATAAVTLSLSPTTAQATGGSGSETVLNVENVIGTGFNDTLSGNPAANVITGGAGTDTVSYANSTAGVTLNLNTTVAQNTVGAGSDTVTLFENLTGSPFNDTLTGNTLANVITGGLGVDTVSAGTGNDTVVSRDGVNDANTVCGGGTDIFTADLLAVGDPNTSNDCETVSRAAP